MTELKFVDTNIIQLASQGRGIDYSNISLFDFDKRISECIDHLENYVFCTKVNDELKHRKEVTEKQYQLMGLALANRNLKGTGYKYLSEELKRLDKNGLNYVKNKLQLFNVDHLDREEIIILFDRIKLIFETNMDYYMNSIKPFSSFESKLNNLFRTIKTGLDSLTNKPNPEDIIIFSNAILHHNKKKEISFVTADKGFSHLISDEAKAKIDQFKIPELVLVEE